MDHFLYDLPQEYERCFFFFLNRYALSDFTYFSHPWMACSYESTSGNFPYHKDGGHVVLIANLKEGCVRRQHEGGSYGAISTNLREEPCVTNMKKEVMAS